MKTAATTLAGQLLIAMPQMQDRHFERSVIFLCVHNAEGAMGLVVNKTIDSVTLQELLEKLKVPCEGLKGAARVHAGGPVEEGRGFVLHSDDYLEENSLVVGNHLALTATLDILRAMGRGEGPRRSLLALGYAGWGPGQLDGELSEGSWIVEPAQPDDVFTLRPGRLWSDILQRKGGPFGVLALMPPDPSLN